ncbi:MAG: ABC transporter substrate-binding protein [Chloroflexota bacterium]|nr:ABC transporter substrate-binding protein [Chloroflexota bacterium]MDQ5866149.1 ABC transporter substrate-binding protein [Chloroflexota bacterium]
MNNVKRGVGRTALYTGVVGAMLLSSLPAVGGQAYAAAQTSRNLGPNNIPVAGRFLEVWTAQGSEQNSVYVNGWPITPRRPEISTEDGRSYETQWFERARYEAHPENRAPYDVLLGRLGATLSEGRGSVDPATKQVRNRADAPFVGVDRPADLSATKLWFPETRHTLSGKFLEYWNKYGGLTQFGLPLSEPFQEVSATDNKTYTVQYFERNRFELHPERAGTAQAAYEVELGLLGVQQYKLTPVAAASLPINPPANVTSAKDTLVTGSAQISQIGSLFGMEESTVVGQRILWAVTFQDNVIGTDNAENNFPLAAWYVPTLENGGSFYVGTGDDRHMVTKFKLRRGIKWSDGKELTSNDMVFSHKLGIDNPNSVSVSLHIKVQSVENPDKYTVVYNWMSLNDAKATQARIQKEDPKTLETTWSFLQTFIDNKRPVTDLFYQSVGSIHPQHKLQNIPVDAIAASDEGSKPTGYGPYMVQEFKVGEIVTLVPNPNYNLTAPPLLKRIINRQVATNVQVQNFVSGAIDLIESEGTVVPPDNVQELINAGGKVDAVPAISFDRLEFRVANAKDGFAQLGEVKVRQAIAHAINKQPILQNAFRGAAGAINSPVAPAAWPSLEHPNFAKEFPDLAAKYKLPVYNYDPARAVALLEEAGWKCPAGTSGANCGGQARVNAQGQKMEFIYGTTANNPVRLTTQQLIQPMLAAVGVRADIRQYSGFFNNDGAKATGEAEMAQFAYSSTSLSGFDPYDSSQINTPELAGGQNQLHYKNPKLDAANRLFSAAATRKEIAEQAAIAQVTLMEDVAMIPLAQRPNIVMYRAKLQNVKVTNSQAPQYWNITQWYFQP